MQVFLSYLHSRHICNIVEHYAHSQTHYFELLDLCFFRITYIRHFEIWYSKENKVSTIHFFHHLEKFTNLDAKCTSNPFYDFK